MEIRPQSCRLQLSDDCCDGLDLARLFSVFLGFCEHMILIVIVSAEDIIVALGGWDKKPTSRFSVHFPRCVMTGKVEICGSLFDGRRVIT